MKVKIKLLKRFESSCTSEKAEKTVIVCGIELLLGSAQSKPNSNFRFTNDLLLTHHFFNIFVKPTTKAPTT